MRHRMSLLRRWKACCQIIYCETIGFAGETKDWFWPLNLHQSASRLYCYPGAIHPCSTWIWSKARAEFCESRTQALGNASSDCSSGETARVSERSVQDQKEQRRILFPGFPGLKWFQTPSHLKPRCIAFVLFRPKEVVGLGKCSTSLIMQVRSE